MLTYSFCMIHLNIPSISSRGADAFLIRFPFFPSTQAYSAIGTQQLPYTQAPLFRCYFCEHFFFSLPFFLQSPVAVIKKRHLSTHVSLRPDYFLPSTAFFFCIFILLSLLSAHILMEIKSNAFIHTLAVGPRTPSPPVYRECTCVLATQTLAHANPFTLTLSSSSPLQECTVRRAVAKNRRNT